MQKRKNIGMTKFKHLKRSIITSVGKQYPKMKVGETVTTKKYKIAFKKVHRDWIKRDVGQIFHVEHIESGRMFYVFRSEGFGFSAPSMNVYLLEESD